jgi:uncharacterized protein (DUF433 family)
MAGRISIDSNVCHGEACAKDTRIPVHLILRMLANGDSEAELLAEYPSPTHEDILVCLDYGASLAGSRYARPRRQQPRQPEIQYR